MVKSIDFDPFMTSKGIKTLIPTFTSKHNLYSIPNTEYFHLDISVRERIY